MLVMALGVTAGLLLLVMALGGSKFAREKLILIALIIVATAFALWYFGLA